MSVSFHKIAFLALSLGLSACGGGGSSSTSTSSGAAAADSATTVSTTAAPTSTTTTTPAAATSTTATSSGSATPVTKTAPAAPALTNVAPANAGIVLNFNAPVNDGGDPVSLYTASCAPSGSATAATSVTATASASPITLSGLVNGATYICAVTASNSVGSSPAVATVPLVPSVSAGVLNLNLGVLANYAAPSLPAYYDSAVQATDNTPAANPINDRAATLGRVLFYDKKLSVNDSIACASCHQLAQGLQDPARFSTGFSGAQGTAHAMRLGNARYFKPGSAFWDRRAASLEAQASGPIQNTVEMGFDSSNGGISALLSKMQGLAYYPELFRFAFGDSAITEARLQQAVAQFERSMISSNSRWDSAYAQVYDPSLPDKGLSIPLPGFTAQEERGRVLFMLPGPQGGAGCARCHVPPTFALVGNSQSNGLDAGETRVFKAPSLKNIALSGAFMHDGRFSTLTQVIQHYSNGVLAGPALDARLLDPAGLPRTPNFSTSDVAALVAFLNTLTDPVLAADSRFSNPFK